VYDGQNSWNELLKTNRRRSPGSLAKVQQRLWFAIQVCDGGIREMMAAGDHEQTRKWIHCLTSVSNAYAKIAIDGSLEERIRELEAKAATAASDGHIEELNES
jgi:hypothetical protein